MKNMRAVLLLAIVSLIAVAIIDTQAGSIIKARQRKGHAKGAGAAAATSKTRFARRQKIIKCCGSKSCLNVKFKQKPQNESITTSNKVTGNGKNNRKTSTTNLVEQDQQKLSASPQEYENPVKNVDLTALEESSEKSSVKNVINVDLNLSEIEAASDSDQAVTFAETFPPNGPLAQEASIIPSLTSSTSEMETYSTKVINSETTNMAAKEEYFTTSTLLKTNSPITTMSELKASNEAAKSYISTTNSPTSTSKQALVTSGSTTSSSIKTSTSTSTKASSTSSSIITLTSTSTKASSTYTSTKTSLSTRTGTTQTTTGTKGYTTATTKAAQVFPTCPLLCKKNVTLFDIADGSLYDPDSYGFWKISSCGILYVFGKSLANWEQNMDICCRIGMTPITIANAAQSVCFNKLIDGLNWNHNTRYWTSGLRSSKTAFKWCSGNSLVASSLWLDKEPSNTNGSENCAQIVISKLNSTAQLDDTHCGGLEAFACQGPTTPPPKCEKPVCPNITCARDNKFYTTLADGVSQYLTNPTHHGYMVELNGRSFLFSFQNDTRTFQNSLLACCSIGMKLLSLQQDEKYQAIIDAMKIAKQLPAHFWTSGTDLGCEGYFGFCTTDRLLRDETRWENGQKDNLNSNEHCLAVKIDQSAQLRDENCDLKMRYICEASLESGAKAVEVECGNTFNLTEDQIKNLMTRLPEALEEKCFLKCYGEGTNMFVNGKLAEDKIYAQFNSVSAGDLNKLMEMYSTMSHCASSTKGMDACDKASQLLKCGKENSPNLLDGMMKNLEISITEAPLVLPPSTAVCPPFNCIIDDDLKLRFDTAESLTFMVDSSFKGVVTHVCNQKIFHVEMPSPVTMQTAMEFCCKFGLRLLTVDKESKANCLKNVKFDGLNPPDYSFMVAASQLGNTKKPIWCFSATPFFPLPGLDVLFYLQTSSTYRVKWDPYNLFFYSSIDSYKYLICESI